MNKTISALLMSFACINALAQIKFEKGYFVDNDDIKTECFIKNKDWKNNPVGFEYTQTGLGDTLLINISQVKEFGIYTISKYIRATVNIDRSSDDYYQLTTDRNPAWSEEQLFLNVLVDSKASLFSYHESNLSRYFFKVNDSGIRQLIYKKYLVGDDIGTNRDFQQYLWVNLKCKNTTLNFIKKLSYEKAELVRYFKTVNECNGDTVVHQKRRSIKDLVHLKITPGIDFSGLNLWKVNDTRYGAGIFEKQVNYRMGLQSEFILPYNKNKWGVILEPSYQYFNVQKATGSLAGAVTFQYQSIELPIGLRHYFFLNDKLKFFINVFLVSDFSFNSFFRFENDPLVKDIYPGKSVAFGAGYEYKKLSVELRYNFKRTLPAAYHSWASNYNKLSFIFGYKLF